MESPKRIGLWIIVGFLALIALGSIPSFACLTAIIIALLIVPIEKWQNFLSKYIKGKVKTIAIVVLVILMLSTFPGSGTPGNTDTSPETTTTTAETTVVTTESTTESITVPTTEPATTPTTEPTATPTTESTTAPTTPPTTAPTTAPTVPTTAPTPAPTAPTTVPTSVPTEPPHSHVFSDATCTTPRTCSCGATEGSATGHNWKDANYTSPKTCTVCGATEGNPLDVPGKENYHGHVYTGGSSSKKYHYEAQCAGKNSHEITWDEVERRGLGPCGTCVLK